MSDAEWFDNGTSQWLIGEVLRGNVARTKMGRRKLRLFACACCRQVWDLLNHPRMRQAVEVAECFAEGLADKKELDAAYRRTSWLRRDSFVLEDPEVALNTAASMAAWSVYSKPAAVAFHITAYPLPLAGRSVGGRTGEAVIAGIVRCIFPCPSQVETRPIPSRGPTIETLARAAYDERSLPGGELDPTRLAILADALEETGGSERLVEHLRTPEPHFRGCWPVDLCTG